MRSTIKTDIQIAMKNPIAPAKKNNPLNFSTGIKIPAAAQKMGKRIEFTGGNAHVAIVKMVTIISFALISNIFLNEQ